jgi:hypothetical protein
VTASEYIRDLREWNMKNFHSIILVFSVNEPLWTAHHNFLWYLLPF